MLARDFYPKEFDKFDVKYIKSPFINWGENIKNQPLFTFFPKTLEGVRNVVTWAHDVGKKVRVSGYRHSWTPVFSENNEILISLMGYKEATELPVEHEPLDGSNPFQFVKLVGQPFTENGQKKTFMSNRLSHHK